MSVKPLNTIAPGETVIIKDFNKDNLINLTKNKTTLVIAHRLSTIIRANKIFVLNQGRIVDIGRR